MFLSSFQTLSQSWLVHALAKGDIARLMEPLFLTLLDPATARVSVLHARIEQLEPVDARGYGERGNNVKGIHNVYAISSNNREIIYHLSAKGQGGSQEGELEGRCVLWYCRSR